MCLKLTLFRLVSSHLLNLHPPTPLTLFTLSPRMISKQHAEVLVEEEGVCDGKTFFPLSWLGN